jgi:hypothetical protein
MTTQTRTPTAVLLSKATMIDAALDALPKWCDGDSTCKSMTRRQQKNLTQAHLSHLTGQVENRYYSARYSTGYKAATLAMQSTAGSKQCSTGLWATVNHINKKMINSPNDEKLTKSTIYNSVAWGDFGVSPLMNSRQGVIPPKLTHGLACHFVMMQASGEGEALLLKMRAILLAITLGTKFENTFFINYLWRKTRLDHPPLIMPEKAIDNKDCRVDWLTYQNINNWNTRAKKLLLLLVWERRIRG